MKPLMFALALTMIAPVFAYFTGTTRIFDGHLMYEYKCAYGGGHTFWVRQN